MSDTEDKILKFKQANDIERRQRSLKWIELCTRLELNNRTATVDDVILRVADMVKESRKARLCGKVNRFVDGGNPCVEFKDHEGEHVTKNGFWWRS
ncbi:hypothetical protein HOT81_gp003 [Gordonia phage Fryberger]|uniref:Uncharacterized protein n=1 Tax=Gordonia phage Fryberger TaxID=2250392 RepID=A0A346FCF9_9CAUD|nr:hypothetical protein HOT81_gp003 [Gordonia phage Fryberger]AXN53423.1 hypothetical protein SEA_FRYBERGER_3 [Gordonia phage Fryberger]QTF81788.1 hypothetical protein SEA_GUEY18_3 [Gordonia phage Guey18]